MVTSTTLDTGNHHYTYRWDKLSTVPVSKSGEFAYKALILFFKGMGATSLMEYGKQYFQELTRTIFWKKKTEIKDKNLGADFGFLIQQNWKASMHYKSETLLLRSAAPLFISSIVLFCSELWMCSVKRSKKIFFSCRGGWWVGAFFFSPTGLCPCTLKGPLIPCLSVFWISSCTHVKNT